MTTVIRKLPAILLALVVAAALALAVGVMTTQAAYAADVQLDKICYNGETDYGWAKFISLENQDQTLSLEDLRVSVLDKNGNLVPRDAYSVEVYATWEDAEVEKTSSQVHEPFGLLDEDKNPEEGGFHEYNLIIRAKDGSGYKGKINSAQTGEGAFVLVDKYAMNWICAKVEFNDSVEEGSWRMHEYYVVPVDKVQDVVVHRADGTLLKKDTDYTASYYVRGAASTDDWGKIWSETNPVDGLPSEPGNYFVKVEGIAPYYGSAIVNLDVIDGTGPDPSKIKYAKAKATKKKPYVVKASKVKKAKQTVSIKKLVKSDVPLFRYEKAGGSKNLSIPQEKDKVTVKKGTKKGTYAIKIKVWPSGTNEYILGDRTVTCYVKVK